MLNAWVHDIAMDDLVEHLREGVLLTLHVDMIMKLQTDREFHDPAGPVRRDHLRQPDHVFRDEIPRHSGARAGLGVGLFPALLHAPCRDPSVTIFLMGGKPGIAEMAADNINRKVGRRMIVGTDAPAFDFETDRGEIERMIAAVNDSGASVCLVGLGGGRQEKFIMRYRDRMPGVRLWLPLGGTIDYESGGFARPPVWVTEWGLEWLYRLMKEPRARFHRYVIHEPPFLWAVLKQKLGLYRNPLAGARSDRI